MWYSNSSGGGATERTAGRRSTRVHPCDARTAWQPSIRVHPRQSAAPCRSTRVHPRPGFTLIELLVVIAIIATLAAVVAPAVFQHVSDAKVEAAKSQIEIFALALTSYRLDNDNFPTTEQGLESLRSMPSGGDVPRNWRGPYLSRVVPLDPWGRAYVYVSPGKENPTSYDLYTLGRDGAVGGTGEDADRTSWGGAVQP